MTKFKNSLSAILISAISSSMCLALVSAAITVAPISDAYAKNENANSKSNNGNGRGNSGNQARSNSGNGNGNSGASKNLNAQLGSLNSLKRNINGLINSNDPKMAGFRAFVISSANLELATQALAIAQEEYDQSVASFLELGLGTDVNAAKTTVETEIATHAALEPLATDPSYAAWEADMAALQAELETINNVYTQWTELQTAEQIAADAVLGTTEQDLVNAIVVSAIASGQSGFSADDITPEMMAWIESQLGVGDLDGAIDSYLSSL